MLSELNVPFGLLNGLHSHPRCAWVNSLLVTSLIDGPIGCSLSIAARVRRLVAVGGLFLYRTGGY